MKTTRLEAFSDGVLAIIITIMVLELKVPHAADVASLKPVLPVANLHLLFWLSLFPFTTAWMGENHLAAIPTAIYGCVLLMAAIAYYILECTIIAKEGRQSLLARAVGKDWKGKLSPALYVAAIPLSFASSWIASALYALAALIWLIPDPRIERELKRREE